MLVSTLLLTAAAFAVSATPAIARDASAQETPKKKKPKAPKDTPPPAPEPTPAPAETAAPAPAAGAAAGADASATATVATDEKAKAPEGKKEMPSLADEDANDVYESPSKTYYFIGLRYTHTVIPKFMINLFVNEGATVHSNSIGISADIRKDGFSLIPTLAYTEYGTDNLLFWQKNQPDIPQNYSLVNSSLKAIYLQADLLWSTKVAKQWDIEYGGGVGMGVIFGDLMTNWVHQDDANGQLQASNGHKYAPCATTRDGIGCSPADHQNASVAKVGGYTEPSWVNGGSKPNIFPHIALPEIGLRIKPIKQFEARVMLGFSITGFFFGINGAYGLERPSASK